MSIRTPNPEGSAHDDSAHEGSVHDGSNHEGSIGEGSDVEGSDFEGSDYEGSDSDGADSVDSAEYHSTSLSTFLAMTPSKSAADIVECIGYLIWEIL
jgi:hypothetical protein